MNSEQYWAGVDGVDGDGECDITVFVTTRYFGVHSSVTENTFLLSPPWRGWTGQVTAILSGYRVRHSNLADHFPLLPITGVVNVVYIENR